MNRRLAELNGIPVDGKHKSDKERIEELEATVDYLAMMTEVDIPTDEETEAE